MLAHESVALEDLLVEGDFDRKQTESEAVT